MRADDTKCFSRIDCLADVDVLQQNINKLMSWSCDVMAALFQHIKV